MIPKIIHAAWLGHRPVPAALLDTWRDKNPGWDFRLHTSDRHDGIVGGPEGRPWDRQDCVDAMRELNGKSDVMRWQLLRDYGGVWVDADTECVQPLPEVLRSSECWAPWENESAVPGLLATCVMAARPGSALFADLLRDLRVEDMRLPAQKMTGPLAVTAAAQKYPELDALPSPSFCPHYYQGTPAPRPSPGHGASPLLGSPRVYGKHHWAGTPNLRRDADGRWLDHQEIRQVVRGSSGPPWPTVSVVIPCYLQAKYLPDSVRSVQNQTMHDVEVVVAASDDESHRVATALAEASTVPVRVFRIEVRGLGNARNEAIHRATGHYVLPLDADDVIAPDFLEKTLREMRGDEYEIVNTHVQEFGDGRSVWRCQPFENVREANAMCCCSLFTRKLWEDAGGYDECLLGYEDWDFWIRCSELSPRVTTVPEALFRYRIHGESMIRWDQRNNAGRYHRAMIHLRHPSLYSVKQVVDARRTMSELPPPIRARLEARARALPHNRALRAFLGVRAPALLSTGARDVAKVPDLVPRPTADPPVKGCACPACKSRA